MTTICTREEIAEKRRIAEEKLKQKLAGNKQLSTSGHNVMKKDTTLFQSKTSDSFYNKQPSLFKKPNFSSYTSNKLQNEQNSYTKFVSVLSKDCQQENSKEIRKAIPIFGSKITCEVAVISDVKFMVKPMKYHEQLINVFKSIPSKQYNGSTHLWSFDICDYEILQERAMNLRPEVELDQIPKQVLELLRKPNEETDFSFLPSIESKLVKRLMPFQKEGVCFGIAKQGRVLIADEMGLGKTLQALAIADYFREDWPILITTTASTRNTWFSHIRDYLSVRCHDIVNLNSSDFYIYDAKIVITSYSLMEKHVEKLIERGFGVLIFDESHNLKSFDAKRTKNAEKLAKLARRVILLSGTPALSKPVELYCQLKMIDKSYLPFKIFSQRYCNGKQTNFGWDSSGQSNLTELNTVLKKKFMIRRLKCEVLSQLAEKNRETVILNPEMIKLSEETKKNFNDFETKLKKNDNGNKEILLTYYAKTAEIKARAVCDYLKSLVKEQKKFLVFAHHKVMMNTISGFLFSKKVDFVRIDGATKSDIRDENVKKFQTKNSCKVALLSLHACNAGITLTAADLVVFAELDWNPSTLAQAESRAHRIGQKNAVTCRYLLAENTADTIIWKMLKEKQDVLRHAGLFSENLQNGEYCLAPTSSPKIDTYFTPTKRKIEDFYGHSSSRSLNENARNTEINLDSTFDPKIDMHSTPTKRSIEDLHGFRDKSQNKDVPAKKLKFGDNFESYNTKSSISNEQKFIKPNNVLESHPHGNEKCIVRLNGNNEVLNNNSKENVNCKNEYEYLFNELDDDDIPKTPAICYDKNLKTEKKEYDHFFNELEDADLANLQF